MNSRSQGLAEPRFPAPDDIVLDCVISASNALQGATFGRWRFAELQPGTQVVCGIFHELIVKEFSTLPEWRAGVPKTEPDVVNETAPQKSFEVKTSSSLNSIASNRYSWTHEAYDPDSYYLCVNFDPRGFTLYRVRIGFVKREAWRPQRGRGNVAMLKREALENLHECFGEFLLRAPVVNITSLGKKTANTLSSSGIHTVGELLASLNEVQDSLSRRQVENALNYARVLRAHGVELDAEHLDVPSDYHELAS
jgi:hypothetical protein